MIDKIGEIDKLLEFTDLFTELHIKISENEDIKSHLKQIEKDEDAILETIEK